MATDPLNQQHLASRARSLDFYALGMWLPNPDPILKAQGKDIEVYRNMRSDALIGGSIRRRKSAVKALQWGLDRGRAASRTTRAVQTMLDGLDLERIMGQMLDCTLYGYQPMEVLWQRSAGLLVPHDVQGKPPEWFCFDMDNQLRFKTRQDPTLGELLPERKFLLPRQDPSYQNPYGFADLSMCFWPLAFKKGGMEFWLGFAEKFGSAFSVGKLPSTASPEERAALLDSLDALIQDGVAVIPNDGSIEIKEMAGKSASADLYERLVLHCRSEISIALLGQNQTTEASSNKASASTGLEVTRELRDGDAAIVAAAMNQLIAWVCQANWGEGTPAPVFSLWDQASQDSLQAARDKSNYDAGARYTASYWMRAYGYQEGDLQASTDTPMPTPTPKTAAAPASAAFAEASQAPDPVAPQVDALLEASAPQWQGMVAQVQSLLAQTDDLAQVQQALLEAYGQLDSAELVKLMAAAYALAQLKGMDAVRSGL
jgi:phage gp29-like protein